MQSWPAICTGIALLVLLVLIIRFKMQAFLALLLVSIGLGLAAGMSPVSVLGSVSKGVGDILASVAILLALGSMLGRMLDVSGAAEVIARTLVNTFGTARASLAILAAAYLIGIPILFNVGFLLLIPIMWRLQRETGQSLLYFVLPLSFALGTTHSLVPPHPGIVGVVGALAPDNSATVMIQTIIFGSLMGIPCVLAGWFGPGLWWARRQMVLPPPLLAGADDKPVAADAEVPVRPKPAFLVCILIVTLPLVLSLVGFGATLALPAPSPPAPLPQRERGGGEGEKAADTKQVVEKALKSSVQSSAAKTQSWPPFLHHAPMQWLRFLGHPTMALLVPTLLAFVLLGTMRGMNADDLANHAGRALVDVGSMAFLFGAAGGFKQIIEDSDAGRFIAEQLLQLPLSPVVLAYVVAALVRIALGSATAAALLAASLLASMTEQLPSAYQTLLVLAIANGVTFMTQPADSGFWLVKEYANISVRDVMTRFNLCRITMSLTGFTILLAYEMIMLR